MGTIIFYAGLGLPLLLLLRTITREMRAKRQAGRERPALVSVARG
jgi:hypothetical protein